MPGYELVDREALAASIRRNIDLSLRTILAGREPSPAEDPEAGTLAIEIVTQLRGDAGGRQVTKVDVGLTHHLGGTAGTCVINIFEGE